MHFYKTIYFDDNSSFSSFVKLTSISIVLSFRYFFIQDIQVITFVFRITHFSHSWPPGSHIFLFSMHFFRVENAVKVCIFPWSFVVFWKNGIFAHCRPWSKGREVKWGEVRWKEVKWSDVRWGEVKWGEVKWWEVQDLWQVWWTAWRQISKLSTSAGILIRGFFSQFCGVRHECHFIIQNWL